MRHIRLLVSAGLLVVFAAVLQGCAPAAKPLETEADFYGFITEIHPGGEGIVGQISMESHADKIVSKYTVTITDETLIFQREGDDLTRVGFTTLENKQWVKIWFEGPVLESFPV